ncbi:TVP38/TMEM64 family protein [Rossellomorea vietnamensis]|uniref:TVP38/TMEM64 family membrane protein n=1 Tax=Rossellomorea vietnamensis TaxID=218284 RepID=A0A5D4MA07_9BACI|nr:VTT domain-containing protein [Rossellomorea vietnamensis]TYR98257.1 TVP38/TMEM64 family protein [Rossellomorea vietnamensis]
MENIITDWLGSISAPAAVGLSILLNIIISTLGVIPSVFLTAANISIFGFEFGLFLSFTGEVLGAIISFILYRKGLRKIASAKDIQQTHLKKLLHSKGGEAFFLVLGLRLFPFAPSGLVTLAGAFSTMGILNFAAASTLGKIPAILIEAYSVQEVLLMSGTGKFILTLTAVVLIGSFLIRLRKSAGK